MHKEIPQSSKALRPHGQDQESEEIIPFRPLFNPFMIGDFCSLMARNRRIEDARRTGTGIEKPQSP